MKNTPYNILKNALPWSILDELIAKVTKADINLINNITQHLSQGKRIRPLLTLACGELIGCKSQKDLINLAAAVEFIHTATLLHDDVIDDSNLRRGKETVKSVWGNKSSILMGDFLLSHSLKLMTETGNLKALELLSEATFQITKSEIWQLELIGNLNLTLEEYIKLIIGKTATLFAAACAVAGSLEEHLWTDKLYEYGLNLGILFQITDDVLDYCSDAEVFGKARGADFLEQKITLPLILLLDAANNADKQMILNNFNSSTPDLKLILKLLQQYNIFNKISILTQPFKDKAIASLDKFQDGHIKQHLCKLVDYVCQRVK